MSDPDEQERFAASVREFVRGMSDNEFQTFVVETRPPDELRPGDAGRAAAAIRHGHRTAGAAAAGRAAAQLRHQTDREDTE